ncbi:MAG: pyridoxamine 5'-phosphate oxidase family protein [Rickettsiales bacterium]|jgi:general stress protein 26|nr:pyridoxamine 5'-phosphate oxidase family protein [Rickettsiales bacterium]
MDATIIDIIKSCKNAHIGTVSPDGYPDVRIMKNLHFGNLDSLDALYFFSDRRHSKIPAIAQNHRACVYYFNSDTRYAIRLYGALAVDDTIDRRLFWNDGFDRFGFSGPDDANFAILKFIPERYKYYQGPEETLQTGTIN